MNTDCQTCLPSTKVLDSSLTPPRRQLIIEQKALAYRVNESRPNLQLQTKGVRAVWDPNIGPGGGWRCPEGLRYGGQITDRFGRGCGGGLLRRVGGALMRAGAQLDDFGRVRQARRLERAANRRVPGRIQRGAERVAQAQERMARALVGDWQPGDGGRRTRRNLPGGPTTRTSRVSRAPSKRRVVSPQAQRTLRTQGSTPARRNLRERVALAQERAARALLGETPVPSRRRRSTESLPDTKPIIPSLGSSSVELQNIPTPEVEPIPSRPRTPSRRTPTRPSFEDFLELVRLEHMPDFLANQERDNARVSYPLSQRQITAMENYLRDVINPEVEQFWREVLSSDGDEWPINKPVLLYDAYQYMMGRKDLGDWLDPYGPNVKNIYVEQFKALDATLNPQAYPGVAIADFWNADQKARLRDVISKAGSRRSRALDDVNPTNSFWRRRKLKKERANLGIDDGASAEETFARLAIGKDADFLNALKSMQGSDLEDLRRDLTTLLEIREMEQGTTRQLLNKRWRKAINEIDKELARRQQVDLSKQKKFGQRVAKQRRKQKNHHVIPALAPNNQREIINDLHADEEIKQGLLPVAKNIENPLIQDEDDAVAALDAGVPLEEIPQQFWYEAMKRHMDPARKNKKQYVERAKNGGICKDGGRGDLRIYEKLDADGNPSGTGVVIGWEDWNAYAGKNGMANNVGEVIGWNLANALGLPVDPARFDGIFQVGNHGRQGIAAVVPFAWNRAPVGTVKQALDWETDPNFNPAVLDGLPDKGYPQRLGHAIFNALIGVTDRHDQNVMGGLVDGQAFVVPMDLGWGGREVYDFLDYLNGEMDYEYDMVSEIRNHLENLQIYDPYAHRKMKSQLAEVYNTMMARAQAIVDEGEDTFVNRVLDSLNIGAYDLDDDTQDMILRVTQDTAEQWYQAIARNLGGMRDYHDEIFAQWGIPYDWDGVIPYPDVEGAETLTPGMPSVGGMPDIPSSPGQPISRRTSPPTQRFHAYIKQAKQNGTIPEDRQFEEFNSLDEARRHAINQFMAGNRGPGPKNPVYVARLVNSQSGAPERFVAIGIDDIQHLSHVLPNDVKLNEVLFVEDIVRNVQFHEIDPTDPDMIENFAFYNPFMDVVDYQRAIAEAIDSPFSPELTDALDFIRGQRPANLMPEQWELHDRLINAINGLMEQRRMNGARNVGNAQLMGRAKVLALAAIDVANILEGVPRPTKRNPTTAESLLTHGRRVLGPLRPRRLRTNMLPLFADKRGLERGRIVVPNTINRPDIQNEDDALNEFNLAGNLMEIPAEYWPAVIARHIQMVNEGKAPRAWLKKGYIPDDNQGAIKKVRIIKALDGNGRETGQAFIMVHDGNPQDQMGELLGWNVMNALGLNIGPARMVGRSNYEATDKELQHRWVVLPHAFNLAPEGELRTTEIPNSGQQRRTPNRFWDSDWGGYITEDEGIEYPENPNYPLYLLNEADDAGLPHRVAAVLSQFIMAVPDRHWNNAMGAVVKDSRGRQVAVAIPIDLGWAGQRVYTDILSMMSDDDIFFDRNLQRDASQFLLSPFNLDEDKKRVAREIRDVVDEMILRHRAIIMRGRQQFVQDALDSILIPPYEEQGVLDFPIAEARRAMRDKANMLFDALQQQYQILEAGEYQALLDGLGVTNVLGRQQFPKSKHLHVEFYNTQSLSLSTTMGAKRRTLVGALHG